MFREAQVPKTAAVLKGNTSGQHHAHECTEAQELHTYQQGRWRRTKAYEQGGAAADFDPWQERRRDGHQPAGQHLILQDMGDDLGMRQEELAKASKEPQISGHSTGLEAGHGLTPDG